MAQMVGNGSPNQDREVLFFTADTCVFCETVRQQLASLQAVYPFRVKEVNISAGDLETHLAEEYQVRSLPTIIVGASQRLAGCIQRDELENVLLRHLF
ncbi:MAG TPA: thioredoxin family protein [Candidatus Lokiarchaeia archaeon]|nr:thioredoxin family protein [Candidatus Lokiarchaeia archaeon]